MGLPPFPRLNWNGVLDSEKGQENTNLICNYNVVYMHNNF